MMSATSLWLVFLASKTLSKRSSIAGIMYDTVGIDAVFYFLVFQAMTESLSSILVGRPIRRIL